MNLYFVKIILPPNNQMGFDNYVVLAPSKEKAEEATRKATKCAIKSSSPVKHGHYIVGDTFLHFENC